MSGVRSDLDAGTCKQGIDLEVNKRSKMEGLTNSNDSGSRSSSRDDSIPVDAGDSRAMDIGLGAGVAHGVKTKKLGANGLPRRRNGKQQACEPCRKAKIACDHSLPVCEFPLFCWSGIEVLCGRSVG